MPCPNCGFISAPGTMFCGKCGTRLTSAPVQSNPYQPPAQPAGGYTPVQPPAGGYTPVQPPVGGYTPSQPAGGYVPPQRPSYIPSAAPAAPVSNSYVTQAPATAPAPTYQSYGSMMQSPYITGAARGSSPVLSSSRDSAAQYTAVSTNVYSPQARAAAVATDKENKKKKQRNVIFTIVAFLILAAAAAMFYISGIFQQHDNSIYVPEDSGTSQPIIQPDTNDAVSDGGDSVSDSDIIIDASASDSEITPDDGQSGSADSIPVGLTKNDFAALNAFVSAFTEVGFSDFDGSLSATALMDFAVSSLSINSNIYDPTEFNYGDNDYYFSISEDIVSEHIIRYFGESARIYPAMGESGEGWLYYGDRYYFTEIAQSQGFAIVTSYSASGSIVTVEFNIYSSHINDTAFYGMTAGEAEEAGCSLVGTGTATLGKTAYNGRSTYLMQTIETVIS